MRGPQPRQDPRHQAGSAYQSEREEEYGAIDRKADPEPPDIGSDPTVEPFDAEVRQRHTQKPSERRNNRGVDQESDHYAPTARAECDTDRRLTAHAGGSGEQQVGDIRAGDEQHERDDQQHDAEDHLHFGGGPELNRDEMIESEDHAFVHVQIRYRVSGFESLEFRPGRLQADTVREAAKHEVPRGPTLAEVERLPDVLVRWEAEPVWHHTQDASRRPAQLDVSADDLRIKAELALPEVVGEQDAGSRLQ